tara:strand:+ start:1512 stop:2051 length:540 start_codon:yes stop_codon:yes gene_type:complete
MATVNLYPSSTGVNSWTLSTGSNPHVLLQDDHTGFVTTDSNYLSATASSKICYLQLDDFTEDHSSIDGVQIVTRAGNNGRGQQFALETKLLPASGLTAYYTEGSGTQAANATYRTQTYTNRTTHDGSTAWNNTLVDGLRLVVSLSLHSGGTTRFTQAYVIVTYTEPVATDNSIFFGTNF